MKPNIVLHFSSSYEEDEYYSSSEIEYKPHAQKKTNSNLQKPELIEISTDSEEGIDLLPITIDKSMKSKPISKTEASKPHSCSIPSKQINTKTNRPRLNLDDSSSYYEYNDIKFYSDECEDDEKTQNLNNNQQDTNKDILPNVNPSQYNYPYNVSDSNIFLASPQDQNYFININGPNELTNPNITENKMNSEDLSSSSINQNQLNRNNGVIVQNSLPIYRCHREISKIAGRPINFKFYRSDKQIMTAVAKGFKHDKVEIFTDGVFVSKMQMKSLKSKSVDFDLFKESEDQIEAEIKFTHSDKSLPREVSIRVYNPSIGLPHKIESVKPKYNKFKKFWQMDFKGKFVLRSIKNTILCDDQLNKLIYVRKTAKDNLDIDILEEVDEIFIFSFAISSFLCKI